MKWDKHCIKLNCQICFHIWWSNPARVCLAGYENMAGFRRALTRYDIRCNPAFYAVFTKKLKRWTFWGTFCISHLYVCFLFWYISQSHSIVQLSEALWDQTRILKIHCKTMIISYDLHWKLRLHSLYDLLLMSWNYYYNRFMAPWTLSGITRVSRYQKGKNQEGKTNLDLLEQETLRGTGICWAMYKFAPHPKQITMPASHHSVFYRPDALPAAQRTASKHYCGDTV